jgi:hypothetical protein
VETIAEDKEEVRKQADYGRREQATRKARQHKRENEE